MRVRRWQCAMGSARSKGKRQHARGAVEQPLIGNRSVDSRATVHVWSEMRPELLAPLSWWSLEIFRTPTQANVPEAACTSTPTTWTMGRAPTPTSTPP